ncbi:MAG: carbohydrate ABC transporter substrate-binding protein [Thermomicrobiales bacterium]|nr:MAG: carbohydrate ABC transporter substrate-binding protein [Thermomicrobiales bacterium]
MTFERDKRAFGRRRFLTGAVSIGAALPRFDLSAQDTQPTPVPTRIQTPDLAFAAPLQELRTSWARANPGARLILSVVPAESSSDSLLEDARSGRNQFAGALVPNWLIPDLARESLIRTTSPPPAPIPEPIAQIRSFGGEWVTTDLDHDCDVLYFRRDLLDALGFSPAETWDELIDQGRALVNSGVGGVGTPSSHAQQVVDHFASVAISYALTDRESSGFWFDPETMSPAIDSEEHQRALECYLELCRTMPVTMRQGSTGDLWNGFLEGAIAYLIGSTDFLPYAVSQFAVTESLGVSQLPGVIGADGSIVRAGNVTGASWGGVVMSSADEQASAETGAFLGSLAGAQTQFGLVADWSSGISPAPVSIDDVNTIAAFLGEHDWPTQTTHAWLRASYDTYVHPMQLPALRIAETRRYLQALENRVVPFLNGEVDSARDVLAAAADDWSSINEAIGTETQRTLYVASLMQPPRGEHSGR